MPDDRIIIWWSHDNLATLWKWLDEIGATPHDSPAYFMEKPWKWNTEYDAMLVVTQGKPPLNSQLSEVVEWLYDNGMTEEASELETLTTETQEGTDEPR